jgi:hypothetical protein
MKNGFRANPDMRPVLIFLIGMAVAGCADAERQPPPPEMVYFKEGASPEDFQRKRAACRAQAWTADPNMDFTWPLVFRNCMRADGWVLVPK